MEVYTSYFGKHRIEDERTAYISVSVGNPKYAVPYHIKDAYTLKPYGIVWKYEGEEYKRRYFDRLERQGVKKIREEIERLSEGKDRVLLLCHEKNENECHRRLFAEWWEMKTGEYIPELGKEKVIEKPKKELQQINFFDIL